MITSEKNEDEILFILQNLRAEDKIEAETVIGKDYIEKTLKRIFEPDIVFFLAKDNNNIPYAMGGYQTTEEKGVVLIWLLSTNDIAHHRHFVLRKIREELKKIEQNNWFIFNYIFEKNYLAKIWLKKFGFSFISDKSFSKGFELFYKKRELKGLE